VSIEELDRQFRHLHQGSVQEFEAKFHQVREERDRQVAEQRSRRRREVEQIARLLDVPIDDIERPHFEDRDWLYRRLAELQPSLPGRPNPKADFARPGAIGRASGWRFGGLHRVCGDIGLGVAGGKQLTGLHADVFERAVGLRASFDPLSARSL
jgi:hypothetical protein